MGCLIVEIGMLIFGIIALVTGKLKLSSNKVVQGPMARVLGAVAMVPLPLAFLVSLVVIVANGGQVTPQVMGVLSAVEFGIGLIVLVIVLGVGFAVGKPEQQYVQPYGQAWQGNAPPTPQSNNPYQAPYQPPPQQGGPFDPFRQ